VNFDWTSIEALCAAATVVVAVIGWIARKVMSDAFTPLKHHEALGARVTVLEHKVDAAPRHSDFQALSARMGAMETSVAVVREAVEGVNAGVKRIEHMTDLLIRNQLLQKEEP
jgi:hypothetical protein